MAALVYRPAPQAFQRHAPKLVAAEQRIAVPFNQFGLHSSIGNALSSRHHVALSIRSHGNNRENAVASDLVIEGPSAAKHGR